MPVNVVRFGPGLFKLGPPGTAKEFGCQVQSLGVNVNKDEGDAITVLCGDSVPGSITYTYSLAGTALQDINTTGGIVEYSWTNAGLKVAFSYTPTTATPAGAVVTGFVIMDPLPIATSDGAYGDVLTSDFEWSTVGKPTVAFGTGTPATMEAEPAARNGATTDGAKEPATVGV